MTTSNRPPDRPASLRVVSAVAEQTGVRPDELEPLYHAIDPDCLDGIFSARSAGVHSMPELTFRYAGYLITVSHDGSIDLEDDSRNNGEIRSANSTTNPSTGSHAPD